MLLTLTTSGTADAPASDLGFLLHKHPDRMQRFDVTAGSAHVFYPVAGVGECTAALVLEVGPDAGAHHVDDRAYAAGSMLAVALSSVFRTAMTGRCAARPELPEAVLPLTVRIPTLTCGAGPDLVRRLFAPLGWDVDARPVPLDPDFPDWGDSRYLDTTLRRELRLPDALTHVYVLLRRWRSAAGGPARRPVVHRDPRRRRVGGRAAGRRAPAAPGPDAGAAPRADRATPREDGHLRRCADRVVVGADPGVPDGVPVRVGDAAGPVLELRPASETSA